MILPLPFEASAAQMPARKQHAGNVLAFLCQIRLRARASGIELDSRLGQVFWIERGLIVRESHFINLDETLRAAGLPAAR